MTQMCLFYCCISVLSSHSVLLFSSKEQAVIKMLLTLEKQLRNKKDVVPSLLAVHALSGYESMPKFYGLGKKLVCSLLQKYPLQHFGEASANISDVIQEGKTFIAAHYGITNRSDMSEIRCIFKNVSRHIIPHHCIVPTDLIISQGVMQPEGIILI